MLILFEILVFIMIVNAQNPYNASLIDFAGWFNTDKLDTDTTAGVFLYFFVFFILVALVVFGEYSKIPAVMFLTSFAGFFMGILFYTTISAMIGVVFTFLSVFYMIRSIMFLKK